MNSALGCIDSFPELGEIKYRPEWSDKLIIRSKIREKSHVIALETHIPNHQTAVPREYVSNEVTEV
jgi:hypothetical protein